MARVLGIVAVLTLVVTLLFTIISIETQSASAAQFLELTKALLSWQVLAAGVATGAGSTFKAEIKERLRRKPA